MGTYKQNAQELADVMNKALNESEGDFEMSELKKAFRLVAAEHRVHTDPPSARGSYKRARGVLAGLPDPTVKSAGG
jgi:hypothetical protein